MTVIILFRLSAEILTGTSDLNRLHIFLYIKPLNINYQPVLPASHNFTRTASMHATQ
jgi:hypothetical protein